MGDLAEARRAERDLLALHGEAPRIEHLGLERQPGAALGPARRLHDHADVEGVTRPVDPPVGEEVRRQLIGHALVPRPADVEAREVETTVAPVERQEAQVGALADDVHQRRALAAETVEPGEPRAPRRVGGLGEEGGAVLADDLHRGPGHRRPGVDRLDEGVLAAVERLLDQDAQIRDQHEPLVRPLPGIGGAR